MKNPVKITILLLAMFLLAQLIGIYVSSIYQPQITQEYNQTSGNIENKTLYNIPYGFEPPQDVSPESSVASIVIALIIAVLLMLGLMKIRAELFLRWWFFVVVIIGIAIALNAFLINLQYSAIIAGVVLAAFGPLAALIIAIGASLGLAFLFYFSKKGKFYPAMPFITIGCFIALGLVYLLH